MKNYLLLDCDYNFSMHASLRFLLLLLLMTIYF